MVIKRILLLISLSVYTLFATAQQKMKTYDREWKKIDSLIEKSGLVKTALIRINSLYTIAKKEKNDPQVVRALLYRMALNNQVSEHSLIENIALLEKEITSAKEPVASLLHSIAGSAYWTYLRMNRWKLYSRTATTGFDKTDMETWDTDDLYAKITSHYLSSVNDKKILKKTKVDNFDPVIEKGNVRNLRPSLFDLLANRAIQYFSNSERDIKKPAYAFEISDSMAFADAKSFAAYSFNTSDSLSIYLRALQLYQELVAYHLNDADNKALADVDIRRLQFVNMYATHPDKNELYRKSLEISVRQYQNADAMYLLAEWHMTKGRTYDPLGDTSNRFSLLKAKDWCEMAIKTKDESEGKSNAANLLAEIQKKQISLNVEKVNVVGEPFRTLVTYRNFTDGYFRVVKIDKTLKEALARNSWEDSLWKTLLAIPVVNEFNYSFPDTKDYQQHRVEIKIHELRVGEYALIGSTSKDYPLDNSALAVSFFYVSNIAFIHEDNKYYILNRRSGSPLPAATIQEWKEEYVYSKGRNELRKSNNYTSDKTGFFELKASDGENRDNNYRLEIKYGNDRLFTDDYANNNYVYNEPEIKEREEIFLFSDRSIYRPGQTVFFKGIVIKKNGPENNSVVTGRKSITELIDANDQVVDSLSLTTNDFGSYSGKFTLPTALLNGEFRIRDRQTQSQVAIHVEEYKRPKYMVEIAGPNGTYRVNDTIQVVATAISYAGNNIDGAAVNFRVVRRAMVPMWGQEGYTSRRWPPFPQEQMEITHGTGTTDKNGKIIISFVAIPDKNVPKDQNSIFYYEVSADVTDINGETRSGFVSVPVSYLTLKLNIDISQRLLKDSLKEVKIISSNINDSFEKAEIKLSIYKLGPPAKVFRERYWEQPDQFIMTKEEYYRTFPYDLYASEAEMKSWPKENLVFEKVTATNKDSSVKVPGKTFEPGWYLFEAAAKDKFNGMVTDKKYVLLTGKELNSPIAGAYIASDKFYTQVGDKINYGLLTNMDSIFIIRELVKSSGTTREVKQKSTFSDVINISDSDKGFFITIKMAFVKNNRIYSEITELTGPSNNKLLNIEYSSFRNKMLPGSSETWKVSVKGEKGEKVEAELLTAMYDASLDQFYPHSWQIPDIWRRFPDYRKYQGVENFSSVESIEKYKTDPAPEGFIKIYDRLKIDDEGSNMGNGTMKYDSRAAEEKAMGVQLETAQAAPAVSDSAEGQNKIQIPEKAPHFQPRINMNETAFFFPNLYADSSGSVVFSFTAPDALTTWKWMMLAHTKYLAFGAGNQEIITQKQLMVQPNAPRFVREGDKIDFSAKVVNMTNKSITGRAMFSLTDPITGKNIDAIFDNSFPSQTFTVEAGESVPVQFPIVVPHYYNNPVTWKIIASSRQQGALLSDGEESLLPVISNRMLITETLPLPVRGTVSKNFGFGKLLKSGESQSLQQHGITVEFTSNPAWYAVQALPYLTEEKYESAEQVFNRFYANALASHLAGASPKLKAIVEKWKSSDTSAFLSNLQKNEELKSVILQETPWVMEARNESQQKKNIALLFDMVRMSSEMNSSLAKLKDMQSPNGGFVWFNGGPEDRYMTQYILSGLGHLKKLGALPASATQLKEIIGNGISYLDQEMKKDYAQVKKIKNKTSGDAGYIQVQYLYMRSFFDEIAVPGDVFPAYNYFRNLSKSNWVQMNTMLRGMIALSLFRTGDIQTSKKIIASLKETSIVNEEMGRYWKDMTGGYYWYQAPVETQSLMIEAFCEITKDSSVVTDLKTWLLKNKQTNSWRTTKATADACYALLLQGSNWLDDQSTTEITLGDKTVSSKNTEGGTGYFESFIPADSVSPSMGNITVKINASTQKPAWGAVYWQYFDDLNKITPSAGAMSINKKLFVQENTDRGPVMHPLDSNNTLHVGDKVKVRIVIRTDRSLEYVHMKDMRASSLEPVKVISSYNWQDGLGYYESTKDASTNFFFPYLPKGTFVFEYELFVTNTGTFNNGVTIIQCLYAPEFSSHSEGIKLKVAKK